MAEQRPESPLWQGTRLVIGLSRRASRAVAQAAGWGAADSERVSAEAGWGGADAGRVEAGADVETSLEHRTAAAELAVGAAARAVGMASDAVEIALGVAVVVGRGLRPLSWSLRAPARVIGRVRDRGQAELWRADDEAARLVDALLPRLVEAVLDRLDLTELVRRHVDLDALAAQIDLDAAADRFDLDRVAARLDLDRIATRLDIDAVAARLDLDRIVARLDLASIVRRLDLDGIIGSVDLDAVVARVDLDAIVARLDLVGLAETVIDGVDLAEIIRSSSGSVASEAVRDVRIQSIEADQAVSGFVDRLIGRRARLGGAIPAPRVPAEETTDQRAEEMTDQRAGEATSRRPGEGGGSTRL